MVYTWGNEQPIRCEHCDAEDAAHHSYSCPTGLHPDKRDEFQPEYFSGLNFKDAEKFKNKQLDFSIDGQKWVGPHKLRLVSEVGCQKFKADCQWWIYCRTCPETYAHPTIKITVHGVGNFELPLPEREAPEKGTPYFVPWSDGSIFKDVWQDMDIDENRLEHNHVHLTKSRAQAWTDFWKEITKD